MHLFMICLQADRAPPQHIGRPLHDHSDAVSHIAAPSRDRRRNMNRSRTGSRRPRSSHARGSAASPGSAGWHARLRRRPAVSPVRSRRRRSSGRPPPSPDPDRDEQRRPARVRVGGQPSGCRPLRSASAMSTTRARPSTVPPETGEPTSAPAGDLVAHRSAPAMASPSQHEHPRQHDLVEPERVLRSSMS